MYNKPISLIRTICNSNSMKNNIETLRKDRGLTLEQLAKDADVSKGGLCDIQNSNTTPSILTAYAIANALDACVYEVFPRGGVWSK